MKDQGGKVTINHLSLYMTENACAAQIWKLKQACPHQRAEDFRKQLGRNVTEIIKALRCPSLESFRLWNPVTFVVFYPFSPLCGTPVGNLTGNVSKKNPVVQMTGCFFFLCIEIPCISINIPECNNGLDFCMRFPAWRGWVTLSKMIEKIAFTRLLFKWA